MVDGHHAGVPAARRVVIPAVRWGVGLNDNRAFIAITTRPNELMRPLHDRMPVILSSNDYDLWLNSEVQDREQLEFLFEPFPSSDMKAFPVSTTVNSPKNDRPECVEEVSVE